MALDGGADGLDVQRRVAAAAPAWLAPGGHLLVETSQAQAGHTMAVFARNGLTPRLAHSDGLDGTVVIGTVVSGTVVSGTVVSGTGVIGTRVIGTGG